MCRLWVYTTVLLLFTGQVAQAQVAVAIFKSVDAVLEDSKYLAAQADQPELARQLDAFLKEQTGGKGLDGVDMTRPFGAFLTWPEIVADLASGGIPGVVFVPVTDEKRFLGFLEHLKLKPRSSEVGLYRLSGPEGLELHLRFANRHAYISTASLWLKDPLPDPKIFLPRAGRPKSFTFTVYTDRLPPGYEKIVEVAFGSGVQQLSDAFKALEKATGLDSEPQFKELKLQFGDRAKDMVPTALKALLIGLVDETRELSVTLDIDRKQHQLALDLTLVPREKKHLAEFAEYASKAQSQFSHLTTKAGLGLFMHLPALEVVRSKQGELIPQEVQYFVPSKYRASAMKLLRAAVASFAADGIDVGFLFDPGKGNDESALLLGFKVRNGRKLDHVLRDEYKNLRTADKTDSLIQWNYERHGKANIHRLTPGTKTEGFLAFREDVVFLAFGKRGLKVVKDALDSFGQVTASPSPLLQLNAASELFLSDDEFAKTVSKAISGPERDNLRARVSLEGGKELRLHLEMSSRLLRFGKILGNTDSK